MERITSNRPRPPPSQSSRRGDALGHHLVIRRSRESLQRLGAEISTEVLFVRYFLLSLEDKVNVALNT